MMNTTLSLLLAGTLVLGMAFPSTAHPVPPAGRAPLWAPLGARDLPARQATAELPERFAAFRLNDERLRPALSRAPMEWTKAADRAPLLELPMPDGSLG